MTAKYRKKPVEIEAVQYDGTNVAEIVDWVDRSRPDGFAPAYTTDGELHIATLEGDMHVSVGDFVIRGVQGEFYPCKPDIFAATYDDVYADVTVAEVLLGASPGAVQVTAKDAEGGQTIEIEDTYVLVTAGRCELAHTSAHANGTHVLTVKNAGGGTKRRLIP